MKLNKITSVEMLEREILILSEAFSNDKACEHSVRKLLELSIWGVLAYEYTRKLRDNLADPVSWDGVIGGLKAIFSRHDGWPFEKYHVQFIDETKHEPKSRRDENVLENAMWLFQEEAYNYLNALFGDDWYLLSKEGAFEVQVILTGYNAAWRLVDLELIPKDGLIADSLRIAIYHLWEHVRENPLAY